MLIKLTVCVLWLLGTISWSVPDSLSLVGPNKVQKCLQLALKFQKREKLQKTRYNFCRNFAFLAPDGATSGFHFIFSS